ncbi:glycosyltransferase family 4 protein [Paenibacillus ginsengarvi]|uniref:Glycosyltransferase n=1 Tax=Paenibacillus ginsengarvi TaxID=400777 RepID=A0A3B0CPN9_9BACL|nr:glycosyltransferase [Paenibacillus ginsengarvi]RKN85656.1 glycosyltransferase [Paenibacillus ginsengarvi]
MKRFKITHIITGLYAGGAEAMLYKLLSKTDMERFEPSVISLMDKGVYGEKIERLGVPLFTVNMPSGLMLPHHWWRLVQIVKRVKPDLLQGWMYHGNLACHLTLRHVPVVWNIRGSHCDLRALKASTATVVWLGGKLSRLPVKIINNSMESVKQHSQLLGYPEEKFQVIPNGFDTDTFKASESARRKIRSELGIPNDAFCIGLIARYHPLKDHATFLKAAARLLEMTRSDNVYFLLVGWDVDYKNRALKEMIEQLRLDNRVLLLGGRSDIPEVTASLDIATLCSTSEGFPNVIGEAMSCEVPCVVTNVGDCAWIVGETGVVVPAGKSEELAQGLKLIYEADSRSRSLKGMRARQRVQNMFSLNSVVERYESLYEDILLVGNRRQSVGST